MPLPVLGERGKIGGSFGASGKYKVVLDGEGPNNSLRLFTYGSC